MRTGIAKIAFGFLVSVGAALLTAQLAAEALPQYDNSKHLGVGSCSSSQCHGATKAYKEGNIRRNEYRQWGQNDKHSKAYEMLLNKDSQTIARKLGIAKAHEAPICLECHTDHVAKEQRGEKYQVSDGIACEACHGGAERWIKSHTEPAATHADNIARGMYRTEEPGARAKLCLSCHYGNDKKFATHRIMAAGHPRLSFELDTFTIRQEHYDIDADYRKRKTFVESVSTWATGVVHASAENMSLLRDAKLWSGGLFPEIALFDCHACHHPMKDRRWAARATTAGLPAGAVRLNDSSLVMLYAVAATVSPPEAERLLAATRSLHDATTKSRDAVAAQSRELDALVQSLRPKILAFRFERPAVAATRKTIVDLGARGEFRDYSGAEQAVMALDLLTFSLGQDNLLRKDIDKLFELLKDDARYNSADFATALEQLRKKIGEMKS